jgi:cyclopropane-fatty-acyl-phospholipid synthase
MWEFYLASSEMAFRAGGLMNFQIQLARRLDSLPLTRDYIGKAEEALRRVEARATDRRPAHLAAE